MEGKIALELQFRILECLMGYRYKRELSSYNSRIQEQLFSSYMTDST